MVKSVLLLLITIICLTTNGQTFSDKELIKAWSNKSVTQTIEAEKTYLDLYLNYNKDSLSSILKHINQYAKKSRDKHLAIRIKMYNFFGNQLLKGKFEVADKESIKELIKEAVSLNDQQLLSELFCIYAEKGPSSMEDKLFYNSQAIDIQERIGVQCFPEIYKRYYVLSRTYYLLEEYEKSIELGRKCINKLQSPESNFAVFYLQTDLLAQSYYETNHIDSGMYYYRLLETTINNHIKNKGQYDSGGEFLEEGYFDIWQGVVKGGLARGFILKGELLGEAEKLLQANIITSTIYRQPNDVAKAKDLLAQVYSRQGNRTKAAQYWSQSFSIAYPLKEQTKIKLRTVDSLIHTFKELQQLDSAVYYFNYFSLVQKEDLEVKSQTKIEAVNDRVEHEKLKSIMQQTSLIVDKQKMQRNFIIAIAVLILSMGGFLYNRYRLKQNFKLLQSEIKRKRVEEESEKMKIEVQEAQTQLQAFKEKLIQNSLLIENLSQDKTSSEAVDNLKTANILTDENWHRFKQDFASVYPVFLSAVKNNYPQITQSDIRYLCLVKLGLNQKEIAAALGISPASLRVTWHRLRQRLNLQRNISADEFVNHLATVL